MTTRPGERAGELWRVHRGKRPCNLVTITRRDGVALRFTDHDRALLFEGQTFTPANFAGMSAERREAGLRTGDQELYGIIDGNSVLVPDLLGDRYRGAEVAHVVTDWSMPWAWIARHRKWIRSVNWTGSSFVATLETRAQVLTRPAGGGLGGVWTERCPKILGSTTGTHPCGADISAWTVAGVTVQTVHSARMDCAMTVASWPGAWTDEEYRDGEIEWTTGDNAGHISAIVSYTHSTRRIKLLRPTPFAITVGDQGTVRVGCDGLFGTCTSKFSNGDNFGGNNLEPSAAKLVEPAEDA